MISMSYKYICLTYRTLADSSIDIVSSPGTQSGSAKGPFLVRNLSRLALRDIRMHHPVPCSIYHFFRDDVLGLSAVGASRVAMSLWSEQLERAQ